MWCRAPSRGIAAYCGENDATYSMYGMTNYHIGQVITGTKPNPVGKG